jgi:hypothetical protein
MRLLNAKTLELVEFFNNPQRIPEYAILSHTWGSDEVSLEDMRNDTAENKAGYQKIRFACQQAIRDGYDFAWVDTCCIQKSSSAELSEAINSMFQWYLNSGICYAYLEGITLDDMEHCSLPDDDHLPPHRERAFRDSKFANHRWFTRGWTLQELIAPSRVQFYGEDWQPLGSSLDRLDAITFRTGIDPEVLAADSTVKAEVMKSFSVAQRMSWAADRLTTRIEDEAYSLLGLFGVNMPLLYGEGHAAFTRLQEEIMKISADQTILAWNPGPRSKRRTTLLLAPTVSCFHNCGSLVVLPGEQLLEPFSMTNAGLKINVYLTDSYLTVAILNCRYTDGAWGPVALFLRYASSRNAEVPSFYVDGISRLGIRESNGVGILVDGNRTGSVALEAEDMHLKFTQRKEIILLRGIPLNAPSYSDVPAPAMPTKFTIHEAFGSSKPNPVRMHSISIKGFYPSVHWRETHLGGDKEWMSFLSLPSYVTAGAICIWFRDCPFFITFGLNGKNWKREAADAWINIQDGYGYLTFREVVQDEEKKYRERTGEVTRKRSSRCTLDPKQFPDDRLEVWLTRKPIWGDVVFEVNCNVTKLTLPHIKPRDEDRGPRKASRKKDTHSKEARLQIEWIQGWNSNQTTYTRRPKKR